jgi:zinc/manganese transport system substrate-binding protein
VPVARSLVLVTAAALAVGGLTACEQSTDDALGIRIVATTNVWGDLAGFVGGEAASVSSMIDSPTQDPHEYQATGRAQLALSKADLVIRNGGGYDDFLDPMLSAVGHDDVPVIDAVALSGYDASAADFNEHVWYDYPTVGAVIDAIVDELSELDPAHAELFGTNAAELHAGLAGLDSRVATMAEEWGGTGVAVTEPVPLYLLERAGLVDRTPAEFRTAVEDDTDVPPSVLRQTLALFDAGEVAVLVYNPQTGGVQTDAVLAAADDAGVPAIAAEEVLPSGIHYLQWQSELLDRLEAALGDGSA